jgi:hypothetical protein
MGKGERKKRAAGKIKIKKKRKAKSTAAKNSSAAVKSSAALSQRNIFVVHTTTEVLQCDFRKDRNTFESLMK